MKIQKLFYILLILLSVFFLGCQVEQDSSQSSNASINGNSSSLSDRAAALSLGGNLISYKNQTRGTQGEKSSRTLNARELMTGQLSITNTATSISSTESWSIYLDQDTWSIQSNKTIILTPSNYDFSLLVTSQDGTQQYTGSITNATINDGTNDIAFTLRPIIGDTMTNVNVIATLAEFKFQYPPSEFTGLTNPKIGIQIDNATEDIFDLSTDTGTSYSYVNIGEGSHKISLKLYDGNVQKGKSIKTQENQNVVAGQNITMNLVPLYGETTFSLTETGGDGSFSFVIPKEVIEETGGTSNTEVFFSLVGSKNPLQEKTLAPDPSDLSGDHYEVTTTLNDLQYGNVTLSLKFYDTSKSPKEELGSCTQDATLDTNQRQISCVLNLRRRAILGGNLYGVLGVNVFDEVGNPIEGATITANDGSTDLALGVTGSGNFGTIGYLKSYLKQRNYTIRAEEASGDRYGTTGVSLDSLKTKNIEVILNHTNSGSSAVVTKNIATGLYHTCSILGSGAVKCWGSNTYGQLGLGDTDHRGDNENEMGNNLTEVDLGSGRTATQIVAGNYHTCILLDNQQVKCWGRNSNGQLGLGNMEHRGDNKDEMGDSLTEVDLGTGRSAIQIVTGRNYTCALLDTRELKCWGIGNYGQLGLGADISNRGNGPGEMGDNLATIDLGSGRKVLQVAAGTNHTCALLEMTSNTREIKCWGDNQYGQLGMGDTIKRGDDDNEMGDNLTAVNLGTGKTAIQVITGANHTCALLDSTSGTREVKCWGKNNYGQLGLGDKENRGDSENRIGDNLAKVDLGAGRTVIQLVAGDSHTCALLNTTSDTKEVKCWGYGSRGQLGLGDQYHQGDNENEMAENLTAVDLGTGRTAIQIMTGFYHTCSLLDNQELKCWGANVYGKLGLGDTDRRGDNDDEMGDNLPYIDL